MEPRLARMGNRPLAEADGTSDIVMECKIVVNAAKRLA